ncbi:MAG: hypothetical protein M3Z98_02735 [Candidatus Dormibacteraeota bacterium]|nr:hypothetical protein [Candidatus Dormibacteraeota bacterium]
MTSAIAWLGLGMAWLGAAVLVLSDARRGLAVGLLVAAVGLAVTRVAEGDPVDAGLLVAGGLLAALIGLRRNPRRGWGLLPAGSTPRIVLSIVVGGVALWLALGMLDSPGDPQTRAGAVIVMALGAGRLLAVRDPRCALSAASLIALGAGTLAALATTDQTGALIGSVAAVAFNLIPTAPESEAKSG